VDGGKITNRENLRRVAQHTHRDPEALYDLPEVDPAYHYLFRYYCDLKKDGPITFTEIAAWMDVTGYRLAPEEAEALVDIDSVYYEAQLSD